MPLLLLASPLSVPVTAGCGRRPTAHLRYPPRLPPPNPKPNPRRLPPPLRCASPPSTASPHPPLNPNPSLLDGFLLVVSFLGILPRDSPERWRRLLAISEEAESRLAGIPPHLIHAITSSEDRRFFFHPGIDCHGISRAIVQYPNGGGGSTITQQLMKRIFLTSERKISRKFIEGLLSLMIEKRMSKREIFYSYLSTMYWGHGIFGIESATSFYFQKPPSFLTVGESALLAGILPGPEILNPFTDPRRGKSSQQRVLRRMVAEGFLDMETALKVAEQPLRLLKENKLSFALDPPTTRSFFDASRPLDPMHLQGGSTLNETTRACCVALDASL